MEKERWAIFDLDGTLANLEHRLHHIQGAKPDWDAFHGDCIDDQPIPALVAMNQLLDKSGYNIAIVTGRDDMVREETYAWLNRWRVGFAEVHMRPHKHNIPDADLKEQIYYKYFYDRQVDWVFDDRQRVVDRWRKLGLTCMQVAKGDF